MDEAAIVRKLITESHINVREREEFPLGVARFSLIVSQASEVLKSDGWLPPNRKGAKTFDGGALELKDNTNKLYECREIGARRNSELAPQRFHDLSGAVGRH